MKKLLFLSNPEQDAKGASDVEINISMALLAYNNLIKCALGFFDKIIVFEGVDNIKVNIDGHKLSVSHARIQGILTNLRNSIYVKDYDKAYIFNVSENNTPIEHYINILEKNDRYKKVLVIPKENSFEETKRLYSKIENRFSGKTDTLLVDFSLSCEEAFRNRYLEFDHFFIFLNRNKGCYTEFIHSATKQQILGGALEFKDKYIGYKRKMPIHIAVVKDHGRSIPLKNHVFFDQDEGCILMLEHNINDQESLKSALSTIFFPPEIFISYGNAKEDNELVSNFRKELQERFPLANTLIDREDIGAGGCLNNFIDRVKKGEHVIIFINDKYLKSKYCIDELYGIYEASKGKADEIRNRIHPFVLDSASYLYDEKQYLDNMRGRWEESKIFEFVKKIPSIISSHYNIPKSDILTEKRIDQVIESIENRVIKTGKVSNYKIFSYKK